MTSRISMRRRVRPGAFLIGSLVALASFAGFAAAPAQAQIDVGFLPVAATWTRGGADTVAWVDMATWKLATSFEGSQPFAGPEPQPWIPVAGDWDGDGVASVQMFNIYDWRLVPAERGPQSDSHEPQPVPWIPVAGDWDGDGKDSVLVFDQRDETLHRLEEGPIPVERYDPQPQPWRPAAGDWDGDGIDTLATVQDVPAEPASAPIWVNVFGDWDGDRVDSAAALHMPTGELVQPGSEASEAGAGVAASPVSATPVGAIFAEGSSPCYTSIKNKTTGWAKFPSLSGGCKIHELSVWEKWTCCLISPWSFKCSVKMESSLKTCFSPTCTVGEKPCTLL